MGSTVGREERHELIAIFKFGGSAFHNLKSSLLQRRGVYAFDGDSTGGGFDDD